MRTLSGTTVQSHVAKKLWQVFTDASQGKRTSLSAGRKTAKLRPRLIFAGGSEYDGRRSSDSAYLSVGVGSQERCWREQ